jgi:hypothetical protein
MLGMLFINFLCLMLALSKASVFNLHKQFDQLKLHLQ